MSPSQDAELEIQQLKDEIRRQDVARKAAEQEAQRARQKLSLLQSSISQSQSQSQLPLSSSPSNPDIISSPIYHEFHVPSAPHAHTTNPFQLQDATSARHSMQLSVPGTSSQGQSLPSSRHGQLNAPQSSGHQHDSSHHAVKRQRTMSQQDPAAHQMSRSHSNLSTRSAGPFSGDARVSPLPRAIHSDPQDNGGMWDSPNAGGQGRAYAAGHTMNRSLSMRTRRRSDLINMPTVNESIFMDPKTYFEMQDADGTTTPYLLSSSMPTGQHLGAHMSSFNMSNISVCESMTSAPTVETTDMTRQNSNAFDSHSVGHDMHMLKLGSQQGIDMSQLDSSLCYHASRGDSSPLGKRTASSEEDLMAVGSSLAPPFAHPYATSAPADGLLMAQGMSRSVSNTSMASNKSSSSLKARAKESLQRQNMRSINTPLKPRPSVDHRKAAESQPNVKKDGKAAITKTKYVRPRQPKVYCSQCDEHKEGFRGEHELRRHQNAKHQGVVKKWICVDPTIAGLPVTTPVVNPLNKCKSCTAKKKYGAYYNAAAHLRRTHFKEKPLRAKNKNAGGNSNRRDDDKRGGKGGGDWPPMQELKNWMQEVWVSKDELGAEDEEDAEEDGPAELGQTENNDLDLEHGLTSLHGYHMPADNSHDDMMSEIDYGFHPGTLSINTDILPVYQSQLHIPISSAHFTDFVGSPYSPNFAPYVLHNQMSQYGSVVSSSETVTPHGMTSFNEAINGSVDDTQFNNII